MDAVTVLRQGGVLRPEITIAAAQACGLDLPSAAAMIMGESGGGRMIWGHDPVDTGGTYTKGGPVTEANYKAFRAAQRAGRIGRQGIGDCQLTSEEYVARAEQIGPGPWDPYCNQLAGFTGLANLQRRYGLQDGFRRYNGSGPAAEAYGRKRMAERNAWAQRLTGAVVPNITAPTAEEDDLTPEQDRMLREVYMQMCQGDGQANNPKSWGWPGWAGGTGEHLTVVDMLRRLIVEVRQTRNQLAGK